MDTAGQYERSDKIVEIKENIENIEGLERQELPGIDLNDEVTKKFYDLLMATGLIQPAGAQPLNFGGTGATPTLELNQWEATDVPIRMDFNEDNAKIDTAFSELNDNLSNRIDEVNTDLSNLQGPIESGSNSNGRWVRYPDGTLMQYRNFTTTGAINTAQGALFMGANTPWTFPIPFFDATWTVCGVAGISGATGIFSWNPPSAGATQSVTLRVLDPVSRASNTIHWRVMAIGRWR